MYVHELEDNSWHLRFERERGRAGEKERETEGVVERKRE